MVSLLYNCVMENESSESNQPSFSEAMMKVQGIMAEVSVMGANDSEFEGFRQILTELKAGKLLRMKQ